MAAEYEARVTFGSGMKYGLGSKHPFKKPMPPKPKKEPSSLRRVFTSPAVFEWIASDGRRGAATQNVNRHREKYIATLQTKNLEKLPVEPGVNDKKSASVNGHANGDGSKGGTKKQSSKVGSKRSPSLFGWIDDLPDVDEKPTSIADKESNGFVGDQDTELLRMKTANMTWKEISEAMGKPPAELRARFKEIKPADFKVQPQSKAKNAKGKKDKKGRKVEKAASATNIDREQNHNAWGAGENDNAGGGAWGDNGDAGGGWGDNNDGAAGDAGGDTWGNNDNVGGGWGYNNNDTGNNDSADGGWENQGWGGGNGSNKSHKSNNSKAGSNNGWAASGWDNGANINSGGSKKSSPSKSHKSNDVMNLGSGGGDGGSGNRLNYRSATSYAGQVVVLVPDDTFSLSDLNVIARIIHTDARDIWFRISCAFGDKTGRRDLNPEAFERKITGQVKGMLVSRASSRC